MTSNFLDSLQVGDKVLINNERVGKVIRITPKRSLFIVKLCAHNAVYGNEIKFTKNGRNKIDEYYSDVLSEWSQEDEDEIYKNIRIKALATKLNSVRWVNVPLEDLEKINNIVEGIKNV